MINEKKKNIFIMNNKYILQGLGNLLERDRKTWVKKNLKNELIFCMKYYLESIS